jgi:GTP-binding protein LepA
VRIVDGTLKKRQQVQMMKTGAHYTLDRVGVFLPGKLIDADELGPGEVGFFTASIKTVADCSVGDTVTDERKPTEEALPGFREVQPVVFCGLFPVDAAKFEDLRAAMGRLRLNDASFSYEMETSAALGFGFRCGFLGLLHLEIIQERLEREFATQPGTSAPASPSAAPGQSAAPKPAPTPISVVSLPANKGAPMKSLGALGDLFRK